MSKADELFEKLHYNKMLENSQYDTKIIYKINYCNKDGLQDRVIIFSKQVGLYLYSRKNGNVFLKKEEIEAILLKMEELENEGWYFKKWIV